MKVWRWLPAILWAALIFVLCSIPGKDIPTSDWMQMLSLDKWVHFGVFTVLMIFVLHGVGQYEMGLGRFYSTALLVLIVIVYGGITELYQQFFLDDRHADGYDFIANAVGAIVGLLIYHRYSQAFYRRFQN